MVITYGIVCSVKPLEKKAPLVVPLIQQNRWLNARKPEELDTEDVDDREKCSVKVADVQKTGDEATDAAVREILGKQYSSVCLLYNLGHIFVESVVIMVFICQFFYVVCQSKSLSLHCYWFIYCAI